MLGLTHRSSRSEVVTRRISWVEKVAEATHVVRSGATDAYVKIANVPEKPVTVGELRQFMITQRGWQNVESGGVVVDGRSYAKAHKANNVRLSPTTKQVEFLTHEPAGG